jgi:hypothetical protein
MKKNLLNYYFLLVPVAFGLSFIMGSLIFSFCFLLGFFAISDSKKHLANEIYNHNHHLYYELTYVPIQGSAFQFYEPSRCIRHSRLRTYLNEGSLNDQVRKKQNLYFFNILALLASFFLSFFGVLIF